MTSCNRPMFTMQFNRIPYTPQNGQLTHVFKRVNDHVKFHQYKRETYLALSKCNKCLFNCAGTIFLVLISCELLPFGLING